jgi:hypothetical protein
VNLSEFFDFSLQGIKDESNNTSISLNITGTWPDYGTARITFCFESWANQFFDMDLSAVGSMLQCELEGGRYLRRSFLMPTGDSINSLTDIRRILSLCGGSRSGSRSCVTLDHSNRIEIPSYVEIIYRGSFASCSSLAEVSFGSDCHVKEIGGFSVCSSLRRIEIPPSVEVISVAAFSEYVLLIIAPRACIPEAWISHDRFVCSTEASISETVTATEILAVRSPCLTLAHQCSPVVFGELQHRRWRWGISSSY